MTEGLKKEGFDRRTFLLRGLATLGAGLVFQTPTAKALDTLFKQRGMPMPSPENREAVREHFFRNARLFEQACSDPEVRKILEMPIDENLTYERFRELEEIMSVLMRHWPTAYGQYVQHLPEYDPREWFGFMPTLSITTKGTNGMTYTGNGTLLPNGQVMTAAHVLEKTTTPYIPSPDQNKDVAVFAPEDAKVEGARQPIPAKPYSPTELRGKIVSIAGWDDPDTGGGHVADYQKVYITGILPITEAVGLYLYLHRAHESNAYAIENYQTLQEDKGDKHFFDWLREMARWQKDNYVNLIILPFDESVQYPDSDRYSSGMSGSGVFLKNEAGETEVVGVFSHGGELHDPIGQVCFSASRCCTDIGPLLSQAR